MRDRPTVLFICSGNIFRSMTADFSLRAHLRDNDNITIGSAGLRPPPHGVVDFVRDHLKRKGIDISEHQPTQLTPAMLEETTLPVAMGLEHQEIIERDFGHRLPLFSEVAYGTVEALRDVWEVVPDWQNNLEASAEYGCSVIDYIHDGMPGFLERMGGFIARDSGKA